MVFVNLASYHCWTLLTYLYWYFSFYLFLFFSNKPQIFFANCSIEVVCEKVEGKQPFNFFLFYFILSDNLERSSGHHRWLRSNPFQPVLFSSALAELAKSIPVQSLILSLHLFFCLPLVIFPFTLPYRIVFAKPEDIETWPQFPFLNQRQEFIITSNGCLGLSTNLLICYMVLYEMFNSLR